ncbi:zinc ribbon domain-containing protein [Thermomicrobium sp. CFH 73360]|uniref:zinc ribbon domain-containing protein n=1 Tax=Thermomicrobium sp. CFH 73360 TaxID=2951987 RepID=UPI0020777F58|nr:zinc-ribbon domain-containing protein [Thermomicrobium sp. CFH 73360]MCM8746092.1 zinc ribbon domain-containing protein [Thermomicrobium sp. CFH 73360]
MLHCAQNALRERRFIVYCPQCGQHIAEDRDVCPVCGAVLSGEVASTSTCPSCGAPRAPDDTYCRRCGAVLPLDLSALGGLQEGTTIAGALSDAALPEWLRGDEPSAPGGELEWLSEAELPDWLREPGESLPVAAEPVGQERVVVPPVSPVWTRLSDVEAVAPTVFAPLPLLSLPAIRAELANAPAAAASESAAGRRAARLALVVALAVLIGVAVYILWLSR